MENMSSEKSSEKNEKQKNNNNTISVNGNNRKEWHKLSPNRSDSSVGVKDLNQLISCFLCKGYLIDATTIVECLHSFCKTCIINHLDSNTPKSRFCPRCDNQIHKTKPKLNIRSDPTLQDIVYKLVPGLYKNEMNRRKEFYSKEPENAIGLSNEERGEMSGERLIFTPEDSICLSIEYFPQVISYSLLPFSKCLSNGALNCETSNDNKDNNQRRYLRCEGGMRVWHLKKWLRNKYDVDETNDIEIMYKHDPLLDEYTMMDLAYIYSWRRNGPLCLYYKIIEPEKQKEEPQFKEPQIVAKRRHTIKHRHKQNKKKKCVHESNLITTNPVNEPLPPVDSALINKVVANNTIGTNIEITTNNIIASLNKNINIIHSNNNNNNNNNNVNKVQSQMNDSVPKLKKKVDTISSVKSEASNNCIELNGLKRKHLSNGNRINSLEMVKKKANISNRNTNTSNSNSKSDCNSSNSNVSISNNNSSNNNSNKDNSNNNNSSSNNNSNNNNSNNNKDNSNSSNNNNINSNSKNNNNNTKTNSNNTNSNNTNSNNSNSLVTNNSERLNVSEMKSNYTDNKTIEKKKVTDTTNINININTNGSKTTIKTNNSNNNNNNNNYNNGKNSNDLSPKESLNIMKMIKKTTSKPNNLLPALIPLPAPDFLFSTFTSKIMPKNNEINSNLEVALNLSTSSKDKTT